MYEKAKYANDIELANKILYAKDGRHAKSLGNRVKANYKQWMEEKACQVMKFAIKQKFSQNSEILEILRQTKDYMMVECNPYDKFWGAGCQLNSKEAENQTHWEGQNMMGRILCEVRQELAR